MGMDGGWGETRGGGRLRYETAKQYCTGSCEQINTKNLGGGAVQEASSLLSSNSERRQDQCVDGGRGGREVGGGNRARSLGPVSPGKGWAKGVALFFHEVDYSFFFFPE